MQAQPSAESIPHRSVLYQPIIHALRPHSPGFYVDGTLGAGGHAWGILEASAPDGQLLGLDLDPHALQIAGQRLGDFKSRAILRQASYTSLKAQLAELGWPAVDGILLDLGVSSMQLDQAERGFSFQQEGPLDMRFSPLQSITAAALVTQLPEDQLAEIICVMVKSSNPVGSPGQSSRVVPSPPPSNWRRSSAKQPLVMDGYTQRP